MFDSMSPLYTNKIEELRNAVLPALGEIQMPAISPAERRIGVDALPVRIQKIAKDAAAAILEGGYDLSYRQLCCGVFGAIDQIESENQN